MKNERNHLDIVLFDHDRAAFLNDGGLITYQPTDRTEGIPLADEIDCMQYWMPEEAIQLAETILAHREELETQQKALELLLHPLADYLLELLGTEKIEKNKYDWGMFMWEIGHIRTRLYNEKHPLISPLWERRMQDGFADNQLEALLEHTLHGKLRERYPLTVYIDEEEQKKDEEKERLPMVTASCHSDDHYVEVNGFDATLWFTQAGDEELLALREKHYRGNYTADSVAEFMASYNEMIRVMFEHNAHCVNTDLRGFECYVNEKEAETWITKHRPHLKIEEE